MFLALVIAHMQPVPQPIDRRPQYSNGVCPLHAHVEICEKRSRRSFFIKELHLSELA